MEESEKCPAFAEGCPYSQSLTKTTEPSAKSELDNCPAFSDGACPFKDVQSEDELQQKMREIPDSHQDNPYFQMTMQHIHEMNQKYTELLGESCPHFKQKCPFKVICEDGAPLILQMERLSKHTITQNIEDVVKLSKELKSGTKEAHSRAESTHFVTEFIKGKVSEEFYALYLTQLYYIYVALEEKSDQCKNDPYFGKLYFPELHRQESLRRDLQFYLGHNWKQQLTMLKSTEAYLACIKNSSPLQLIAHAYTRFLGDLSGGQILKKKAQRHYGLPGDSGVQFYQFDLPISHHEFKQKYRKHLDILNINQQMASEIVAEANKSFNFNTDLFLELDSKLGLEPKPVVETPRTDGGCPFGFVANPKSTKSNATSKGLDSMGPLIALAMAAFVYLMWRTSA